MCSCPDTILTTQKSNKLCLWCQIPCCWICFGFRNVCIHCQVCNVADQECDFLRHHFSLLFSESWQTREERWKQSSKWVFSSSQMPLLLHPPPTQKKEIKMNTLKCGHEIFFLLSGMPLSLNPTPPYAFWDFLFVIQSMHTRLKWNHQSLGFVLRCQSCWLNPWWRWQYSCHISRCHAGLA